MAPLEQLGRLRQEGPVASVKIPLRSDLDNWSLAVDLDEVSYQLHFCWNVRDEAWALDIRDGDGDDLLSGVMVRVDVPLNGLAPRGDLPPGQLMAIDTSGEGKGIDDKEDLGERVQMIYVPEDDV